MGICGSKDKKDKKKQKISQPQQEQKEKNSPLPPPPLPLPQESKYIMNEILSNRDGEHKNKKQEENENTLENNAEIMDEAIHNDNMKNINREFLPNQVYTQHFNAIIRNLNENNKKEKKEFGQTDPVQTNDGLCTLETYGSYGQKKV